MRNTLATAVTMLKSRFAGVEGLAWSVRSDLRLIPLWRSEDARDREHV
jgi:hypothetical protein